MNSGNFTQNLTFSQTYTAKATSVLPVLLSAIRVSPPSEGPAHDGKTIGKDAVSYEYKQVWQIFIS
jgi:leukotriene-A4 hydrolase